MDLKSLAKQPQLIQVSIDDEDTLKEFGEPITFWCYDRQPLDKFLAMADNKEKNLSGIMNVIKDMILDENGEPVLKENATLPNNMVIRVVGKMIEVLGK